MAQLVARLTGGQEAVGSSPVTRTMKNRLNASKMKRLSGFFFYKSFNCRINSGCSFCTEVRVNALLCVQMAVKMLSVF